jgi:hypothetical protein
MEDEIQAQIEKIRYHIEMLAETVDYRNHPVESLVLSLNWSRNELDTAHDIFDEWEKRLDAGEAITPHGFENDFSERLELNYQLVKTVVNAFYRNGQWTAVCEAFVDSMGDSPSVEYLAIKRRERF